MIKLTDCSVSYDKLETCSILYANIATIEKHIVATFDVYMTFMLILMH